MSTLILETQEPPSFVLETAPTVAIEFAENDEDFAQIRYLRGEKGDDGDVGETGPAGANFIHTQSVASDAWVVNHNLGYFPNTTVLSVGGRKMEAEVLNISVNQLTVYFDSPLTGQVVCS